MNARLWMFGYAGFLLACGGVAYMMAPEGANPATALIVSSATAVVMIVCGVMAGMLPSRRAVGMLGIHAGLVLPMVFAVLFAWRAYGTFSTGGEPKRYLAVILAVMSAGSVAAFLAILMHRPPRTARG